MYWNLQSTTPVASVHLLSYFHSTFIVPSNNVPSTFHSINFIIASAINPHISYLICSNYLSTCWSIQLISYYVNRDYVFFVFPAIILDNKQKRGCEKTLLSFFTAPIYIKYFFNLHQLAFVSVTFSRTQPCISSCKKQFRKQ